MLSSILRRLGTWGIQSVEEGPEKGAFCHPKLRRDNPSLACEIRRADNRLFDPKAKTKEI